MFLQTSRIMNANFSPHICNIGQFAKFKFV